MDLGLNKNLFVVATILICGIGGLVVSFGHVTLTAIACALILGILANILLSHAKEGTTGEAEEAVTTDKE